MTDNLYVAVAQLTRLRLFRFDEFDIRSDSILRLLKQPPFWVQQLIFFGCLDVTYPVLEPMEKIKGLSYLTELGIYIDVTISEYAQFLEFIGEHTNLSYLECGLARCHIPPWKAFSGAKH